MPEAPPVTLLLCLYLLKVPPLLSIIFHFSNFWHSNRGSVVTSFNCKTNYCNPKRHCNNFTKGRGSSLIIKISEKYIVTIVNDAPDYTTSQLKSDLNPRQLYLLHPRCCNAQRDPNNPVARINEHTLQTHHCIKIAIIPPYTEHIHLPSHLLGRACSAECNCWSPIAIFTIGFTDSCTFIDCCRRV